MKIGFNLLSLPDNEVYGVGMFLREMCKTAPAELAKRDVELRVFHHADRDPGRLYGLDASPRIRWIGVPGLTTPFRRVLWEQLTLPRRLEGIDILYSPNNINPLCLPLATRSVVTIHDMLPFNKETRFGIAQRLYLRCVTRAAARRAARVITVSAASAADIAAHLGVATGRITVVRNVIEKPVGIVAADGAFKRSFVIIGSLHRDKQIDLAIRGFHRFVRHHPGHRLVVFGTDQGALRELRTLVAELDLQDCVEFKGYVDESVKWSALSACLGVLLFGRREGFGIPVLEAMAVGKPSVVAPSGALPEVVGGAGLVVAPDDADGVAGALECLAVGPGIEKAIIDRRYRDFDPATQRGLFWETIVGAAN